MKQLPIDVSPFRTLITENYLYIDKTEHIYNLIKTGRYYFFSRPRRFGKSLLVSTFKELFAGNRELFKGLWIDSSDYEWTEHPVIDLDFSLLDIETPDELKQSLAQELHDKAETMGIDLTGYLSPGAKLKRFIKKVTTGSKSVVVLIDEYDSPLVGIIGDPELVKKNQQVLSRFFAVLKGLQEHIRFIFITGVSKFSKVNVFSGLNNLNDISLSPVAATILGYTEQELDSYFSERISSFALSEGISDEEMKEKIRLRYNGYQFSEKPVKVYNPFSLQYLFHTRKFANYWFQSGTPTFLVELLKRENYILHDIEQVEFSSMGLDSFNDGVPSIIPLLFQTGYLTISSYNVQTDTYTLTFPNSEVRESFKFHLISAFVNTDIASVQRFVLHLREALSENDMKKFCINLEGLFAHVPYQIQLLREAYYHSIFQLIMTFVGFETQSDVATNKGRIDMVITTRSYIYVLEIKFNTDSEKALKQIEERGYFERYRGLGKTIGLVGITFSTIKEKLTFSCSSKTL